MYLRQAILKQLLKTPMSLSDIQKVTKASMPTVRRAVQTLTDSKWIGVSGHAEANGGRPAMLFDIDNSYYMVFGLHLQLPGLSLIATDLSGNILKRIGLSRGLIPDPNQVIRDVAESISEIKKMFPNRQALGLGIAAPGFIDLTSGDIIAIGRAPNWENFPICKHLSEATGLPVDIANDVDCMAIVEFADEEEPIEKNLSYVAFCEGIKASLMLKGELYKGTLGNVGLISPNLLNICNPYNQEEMERIVTSLGFSEVFRERVQRLTPDDQKLYESITHLENHKEQFSLIAEQALDDKNLCFSMITELFRFLSVATANLILIIQPDEIVFGGLLSSMPNELFLDLEKAVRKNIPSLINNNLIIKKGVAGSRDVAAIGATHHFLRENLLAILKEQKQTTLAS